MQYNTVNHFSPSSQIDEIQTHFKPLASTSITSNPLSENSKVDFSSIVTNMMKDIDLQGQKASEKVTAVDLGKSDDLVGAMVASQTASLSFAAMVQVRNKLLTAYDDIMRMPV